MKLLKSIVLLTSVLSSSYLFASQDLTGKWRSIDDKTGFSKAIIEIKKDDQGRYTGTITEIMPRPGYTPQTVCVKCKGSNKNKSILGMQILQGMKQSQKNPLEFSGGTILDPLSGHTYKTTGKLNASGSRLNMRGFVGVEALGRSQTWLREE